METVPKEKQVAEIGLFDFGEGNLLILKHHFFSKSGEINVDRGDVNAIIQTVENIPRGIYR